MRKTFRLSINERRLEWLLLILTVFSFIIIGKGVYNQDHNIDQDFLLLSLLSTTYFIIFMILGMNGLKKGNLLPKWTPFFMFQLIAKIIMKTTNVSEIKAEVITQKILGIFNVLFGILLIVMTLTYLKKA